MQLQAVSPFCPYHWIGSLLTFWSFLGTQCQDDSVPHCVSVLYGHGLLIWYCFLDARCQTESLSVSLMVRVYLDGFLGAQCQAASPIFLCSLWLTTAYLVHFWSWHQDIPCLCPWYWGPLACQHVWAQCTKKINLSVSVLDGGDSLTLWGLLGTQLKADSPFCLNSW